MEFCFFKEPIMNKKLNLLFISFLIFSGHPASADFIESLDDIFANQSLCVATDAEQVQAEINAKAMLARLKKSLEIGRRPSIEVQDLPYEKKLRNRHSDDECIVALDENCYHVSCE